MSAVRFPWLWVFVALLSSMGVMAQQPFRSLSFGEDALQQLDVWAAPKPGAPLLFFIHGGGWKIGDKAMSATTKAAWARGLGLAFASSNYRLVPKVRVEDQLRDLARALALLHKRAADFGVDASRLVLMGHSAGAHLAAMLACDPRWLEEVKVPMRSLAGVILLDGAGYDVARQAAQAGPAMRSTYAEVFGGDLQRQQALSPLNHAAAPNAQAFLILHVQRRDGESQSKALAAALLAAGTKAQLQGEQGVGMAGHIAINRGLGAADHEPTAHIAQWLRARGLLP